MWALFDSFEKSGRIAALDDMHGGMATPLSGVLGRAIKRLFDIVFATVVIVTFGVLMLGIALALRLRTGGPCLFRHSRVGRGGKIFPCLKFRTMVTDAEAKLQELLDSDPAVAAEYVATRKIRNDPRIIPGIGTFLRKTSLDELPQFFNVLAGHMSVVGPRPVTVAEFRENYGFGHPYVLVRPGITGLWQISGRNDVTFAERVRMDASYVRDWSLLGDIAIILRTLAVVCVHRNGH